MDTAALKNFAPWARRELTREVDARLTAALAPGSADRIELTSAVTALEADIANSGDRDSIVDKVAYTWFNRIIALRFMDANNYTGIGVVSPAYGQPIGQPEVLADAKRGSVDPDVVHSQTRTKVLELLDGTRRSNDSQGEAYRTLLAAYCGHWSEFMPFMFEREEAYTNLLMPGNLLADESVLNRAVEVLTPEVCEDVEVIGWLYQFYISERKNEVFAGFKAKGKARKLAGPDEIPAATQLFTPEWIVRYLVENSLGRLWMLNRPDSSLVDQMDYYIAPVDEETDFLRIDGPEELTIIDPACGSGHMLTYAFDLLYAIYEEEGYAPSEIPTLILTHNIYGTEIDERAGALAAFALTMKARAKHRRFFSKQVDPHVCVLHPIEFSPGELSYLFPDTPPGEEEGRFWNQFNKADSLGSLITPDPDLAKELKQELEDQQLHSGALQTDSEKRALRVIHQASILADRYAVTVMNPPYMGNLNLSADVSAFVKENFPDAKQDLYACFMVRGDLLTLPHGYTAMITGDTWMTIKSFENHRKNLLVNHAFLSFIHMRDISNHPDIFGANTAFVVVKDVDPNAVGTYFYLNDSKSKDKDLHLREAIQGNRPESVFLVRNTEFLSIPGAALAFRISATMRAAFGLGVPLKDIADPRQGMATADNDQFLRLWHEVPFNHFGRNLSREEAAASDYRWFPYNKGGEYRKWYGNQEWVVNWFRDGEELLAERPKAVIRSPHMYFRPSVSWSKIGTGLPSFRYFPAGFLFDVAGTSIFTDQSTLLKVAALCNSNVFREILQAISPTLNVEVGTIAKLPIADISDRTSDIAEKLIQIHRDDWNRKETSWDFSTLPILNPEGGSLREAVKSNFDYGATLARHARSLENELNNNVARSYGLAEEVSSHVPLSLISLDSNPYFKQAGDESSPLLRSRFTLSRVKDLISYAVGCMFGRYSLDEPGLILADQGSTLEDYLAEVPEPTFTPDADNVLPIIDGDWFEDDIVSRFREFLRVSFGEQHFEENLRFVEESLGVQNLRNYFFITSRGKGKSQFYEDHVRRYSKRPIYWLFSSPSGSFNALIYLHRYTPSTASTVLNEYLREYIGKLEASLQNHERNGEAKEADRIRKILMELRDYEHDVLYPLASQQIALDLDDGVKVNYPKIGTALKKISGLGGGK